MKSRILVEHRNLVGATEQYKGVLVRSLENGGVFVRTDTIGCARFNPSDKWQYEWELDKDTAS